MKKRFIILSDLHLGEGRIINGQINYKEDFVYDEDFYEFLRWWVKDSQSSGYDFTLVLNGDIFDIIKSIHKKGKVYKKDVFQFLDTSINNHRIFFNALKDFESEGGKTIYIVGNHDHPVASPEIQTFILEKTGLKTKFIKREFFEDGLWIEHGNKYEVINRTDLVNVWLKDENGEEILNMPWGTKFVVEVIASFAFEKPYIDRWRPLGKAMKWGLIFDTKITLLAIIRMIKFMMKNRKIYDPIRRRYVFIPLSSITDAMGHKIVDRSAKILLKRPDIKVVVMGHTHKALLERYIDKVYANSGTWVPFVSFDAPYIGIVDKRSFVIADIPESKNNIFVGAFIWHGRERMFEEIKEIRYSAQNL